MSTEPTDATSPRETSFTSSASRLTPVVGVYPTLSLPRTKMVDGTAYWTSKLPRKAWRTTGKAGKALWEGFSARPLFWLSAVTFILAHAYVAAPNSVQFYVCDIF